LTRSKTIETLRRLARFLESVAEDETTAEEAAEDLIADAEDYLEGVESAIAHIEGPEDEDEDEDEFDDDDEIEEESEEDDEEEE